MPFRFRVAGVVKERESGQPLGGLLVRAFDHHWFHDDALADARTDESGRFHLHFAEPQFTLPFETRPDLYVAVLDPGGERVIHSTRHALRKSARVEECYEIEIPRAALA